MDARAFVQQLCRSKASGTPCHDSPQVQTCILSLQCHMHLASRAPFAGIKFVDQQHLISSFGKSYLVKSPCQARRGSVHMPLQGSAAFWGTTLR